jgi:FkbM family methyltransferase
MTSFSTEYPNPKSTTVVPQDPSPTSSPSRDAPGTMDEHRTMKGRLMALGAFIAVSGPWRRIAERLTCAVGHTFPNSRIVASFCRHFGGQLQKLEGERFARVVTFDSGGRMLCSGEDRVAANCAMYYFLGTITNQDEDERPLAMLLTRVIREGDTFLDIGANVGFYSFFVGPLCGPTGTVHAFEANPLLIQHLKRSADFNKPRANIVVNPVAVGSEGNKTLQLYDPERIGGSSLYQLEWLNTGRSVTVPLTTIDDYVRQNRLTRIDVVKIDIEGAELDAFRGMQETFRTCPPAIILCELVLLLGQGNAPGSQLASTTRGGYAIEVMDFLAARGYETRSIREENGLIGEVIEPETMGRLTQNLINVAFVRTGLKAERPELFSR